MTKVFVYFTANKVLILQSESNALFSIRMKKFVFLFLFLVAFAQVEAQKVKVGLKLAPAMSFNRMSTEELDYKFDPDGLGARFAFGPIFDYYLGENYDFHTGVLFVPKRVGITATKEILDPDSAWSESYKLQYIQIPLALKMYTDELGGGKKIYFLVGGLLDIKIFEEPSDPSNVLIDRFRFVDISALLGAGLQTQISGTTLETGLSYCRGLGNVAKDRYKDMNYTVKNDLICLDIVIKF